MIIRAAGGQSASGQSASGPERERARARRYPGTLAAPGDLGAG